MRSGAWYAGQANPRLRRLRQLLGDVRLIRGDLLDQGSLISAVERVQPDEVYNLAAISYVPMSWQQAELTGEVTGLGVLRVLEAIRVCSGISSSRSPAAGQIRFYQASSSEMFGKVRESPQTEQTPFHPRSPYGVAKVYGHLPDPELPRVLRHVRGVRDPVQPRVTAPRGRVRHPEGLAGRRQDQARLRAEAAPGQPEREQGLGLRRRLRPGHAADAAAGRARRLRHRNRRHALRWRSWCSWPSARLACTGATTWSPTRRSSGPPRWTGCAPTRPRHRAELGWEPKIGFEELVAMMVDADLELLAASGGHDEDIRDPTPGSRGAAKSQAPRVRPSR